MSSLYNQIFLNEGLVSGDFKFGFEFEFIAPEIDDLSYEDQGTQILYEFGEIDIQWQSGDVVHDVSLKHKDGERGYEYVSQPLVLSPRNISKIKKLLVSARALGYKTNASCGFHIHFSYPNMSEKDLFWVMCKMSEKYSIENNPFMHLGDDIEFFEDRYASYDILEELEFYIKHDSKTLEQRIEGLLENYNSSSDVFKIHEQGTLEWRGPRNFMHEDELISKTLKMVFALVKFIAYSVESTAIKLGDGTTLSKEQLYASLTRGLFKRKENVPIIKKIGPNTLKNISNYKGSMVYLRGIEMNELDMTSVSNNTILDFDKCKINKLILPPLDKGYYINSCDFGVLIVRGKNNLIEDIHKHTHISDTRIGRLVSSNVSIIQSKIDNAVVYGRATIDSSEVSGILASDYIVARGSGINEIRATLESKIWSSYIINRCSVNSIILNDFLAREIGIDNSQIKTLSLKNGEFELIAFKGGNISNLELVDLVGERVKIESKIKDKKIDNVKVKYT